MSANSRLGYTGEAETCRYLSQLAPVWRPRTTSRTDTDTGDVAGLPLVVSVKNHARLDLAGWVDEVERMVTRSEWNVGVVVHKRRGHAYPGRWYLTTSMDLALPVLAAYVDTACWPPIPPPVTRPWTPR